MTRDEMLAGLRRALGCFQYESHAARAITAAITALEAYVDTEMLQSLPDAPPRVRADKPAGNVPRCFARPSPGQPSGGPCELESGHVGWHRRGGMEWGNALEAAPAPASAIASGEAPAQVEAPPSGICSAHQRGEDRGCALCYPPSESARERARQFWHWFWEIAPRDVPDAESEAKLAAEFDQHTASLRAELEQDRGEVALLRRELGWSNRDLIAVSQRVVRAEQERDAALAKVAELERDLAHLRENAGEDSCADVLAKARVQVAAMAKVVEAARRMFARVPNPPSVDHACGECVPDGDIVCEGFQCAWHAMRAALAELDKEQGR